MEDVAMTVKDTARSAAKVWPRLMVRWLDNADRPKPPNEACPEEDAAFDERTSDRLRWPRIFPGI
jgi:hypothetical protein